MRIQIILLLTFLLSGTGWAQSKHPTLRPEKQVIGTAIVWRVSDRRDELGHALPPWKEIKVTNIFGFRTKPVIGTNVTVIPLEVGIPAFDLKIVSAKKQLDACDDRLPPSWEVTLEPIKQKEIFEIAARPDRAQEFPFDVCVVYPSVKFAHQISRNRLTNAMLPKEVALSTVIGAIDLTGDGIPDVLRVEYCCEITRRPSGPQCDYTCGKTFRKIRNVWKLIDTSAPC